MDILAAIFAYLGCVTGIVCALVISFVVYFSPAHHAATIKHTVTTAANAGPASVTTIALAKPAATTAPADKADKQDASGVRVSAWHKISPGQHYRRLVEEERTRRLAYQQNPEFEARFLGYAD